MHAVAKTKHHFVSALLVLYVVNCRISDPTGIIWGIKLYKLIISRLFDPQRSSVKLKRISATGPSSIEAVWSKEGFLQLPWNPYLTTQEGKTVSPHTHECLCTSHPALSEQHMVLVSMLPRCSLYMHQCCCWTMPFSTV